MVLPKWGASAAVFASHVSSRMGFCEAKMDANQPQNNQVVRGATLEGSNPATHPHFEQAREANSSPHDSFNVASRLMLANDFRTDTSVQFSCWPPFRREY
jgi:hypothetical protein